MAIATDLFIRLHIFDIPIHFIASTSMEHCLSTDLNSPSLTDTSLGPTLLQLALCPPTVLPGLASYQWRPLVC